VDLANQSINVEAVEREHLSRREIIWQKTLTAGCKNVFSDSVTKVIFKIR
jgi:hypothetical protein